MFNNWEGIIIIIIFFFFFFFFLCLCVFLFIIFIHDQVITSVGNSTIFVLECIYTTTVATIGTNLITIGGLNNETSVASLGWTAGSGPSQVPLFSVTTGKLTLQFLTVRHNSGSLVWLRIVVIHRFIFFLIFRGNMLWFRKIMVGLLLGTVQLKEVIIVLIFQMPQFLLRFQMVEDLGLYVIMICMLILKVSK
jgi:hypothetical protein